jgi:hypothetical protein
MKDVSKIANIIVTYCNVWYLFYYVILVGPKLDNYGIDIPSVVKLDSLY